MSGYFTRSRRRNLTQTRSNSDDNESEDEIRQSSVRRKLRVLSSSSGQSDSDDCNIAGPSRKKRRVISSSTSADLSETAEVDSDDSDIVSLRRIRSREKAVLVTSDSSEEGVPERRTSNGSSSDGEGTEKCIICFTALNTLVAKPTGCNHKFHSECLGTWSKTSNTCPIDRVKYKAIQTFDSAGDLVSREEVKTPPPQEYDVDDMVDEPTVCCEVCYQHDREGEMLLCDRCDDGYHMSCLSPPLSRIPAGSWFCPLCRDVENMNISDDDVGELFATPHIIHALRPSTVQPTTRSERRALRVATQAALWSIREQRTVSPTRTSSPRAARSRPATRTRGRRTESTPRRRPRARRSTTYKVELVTVEDGSTIEVKLAVNAPRRRKSKKKKKKKTPRNGTCGKLSTKRPYVSMDGAGPSSSYSHEPATSLDLFGTRPQLDYFSGCDAEDELDEEGGASGGLSLLVQRASRLFVRSMSSRKHIAARVLNSSARRSRPINASTAPIDLVSSILEEQEKWLNPNSVIHSTSDGRVQVTLKDGNVSPRKIAGVQTAGSPRDQATGSASGSSSGNSETRGSSVTESTSSGGGGSRGSIGFESRGGSGVIHPLPPPPIPPSHLVDEEDFDLYADIEAPKSSKIDGLATSKLAPPPEPPAILLAMNDEDRDEAGSSPESLVIDDERQVYDPDLPTSPPSPPPPPPKLRDFRKEKSGAQPSTAASSSVELIVEYPPVHEISLPPASPPSPKPIRMIIRPRTSIEDCPNRSLYSSISRQLAQGKSSDSDDLASEDDALLEAEDGTTAKDANGDHSDSESYGKNSPGEVNSGKTDEKLEQEEGEVLNNSGTTLNSEENHSDVSSKSPDDQPENDKSNGVQTSVNGSQESLGKGKTRAKVSNGEKDGETEGEIDLGCEEDKDGLVDITDDEISNYEQRWELEEDNRSPAGGKTAGLEGLETEAISDCEYNEGEERNAGSPKESQENGSKEEGEIVAEERPPPVAWKKLSKGTKERSYRDKDAKEKIKKKESKKKEKKKELERYDVRKLISEKPRRKVDEFGRDISSKSRSRSRTHSPSAGLAQRSLSRGKRKQSVSRTRVQTGSKNRARVRSKSRGRSRERSREVKGKRRSQSRSRRKSRSRSRKRQRSKSPPKKKEKERERGRPKSKEKTRKKRAKSSASSSSCSCSSCEREKRRSRKLTVTVPNKPRETAPERAPSKEKRKSRPRYKEAGKRGAAGATTEVRGASPKRRRVESPAPSKEVFTSGDNILVSVNFKASKSGEGRSKESSKKRRDEDGRKKKDKGTKENQPARSTSSKGRKKLNTKNMKPVAIIDLVNASPFRELSSSPKEVIILTDSDSEEKKEAESEIPILITGPKTPPEPHIKFNLVNNKQQQLRNMSNPLLDSSLEQAEEGEDETSEIIHKGPNTPPEPPVPYDPFEPTKSRSPTPNADQSPDHREASPVAEIDICQPQTPPPPQPPMTPPKTAQHESPKTPSPLHTPPLKPVEDPGPVDKPKPPAFNPTTLVVSEDDSVDMVGGDSPYSPGSAEGDDLFEPPVPLASAQVKPKLPTTVPRPIPLTNKHAPLKLTPSPLKKRPASAKLNSTPIKSGRGNFVGPPPVSGNSKREIGIKLDEDQLKILDELPNSAVEMQVKDKFLKKLNRQERVVEEVKLVLKPHYAKKHITKEDYKEILRKSVPKICHSKSGEINPAKIQRLIEAYVKKFRHKSGKRKSVPPLPTVQSLRNNKQKTMWC